MLPDAMFAEPAALRWVDAATSWLLTYLVHSTIMLLGAWVITSWRRVSYSTRDVLWKAALVGGVFTASVQAGVAREPLGGQLRVAPALERVRVRAVHIDVRGDARGGGRRFVIARREGLPWTAALVALWLTGAGVALLRLTVRGARTDRLLGERDSLETTEIARRLHGLLARAGVRRRIELTCSSTAASPVALPNGEVCLPRRALVELGSAEQDSMLAHEVAHVVRRDPQWLVVARVIEAVLFVQPLNRLARYRMQEAAEFLCDDWAVQRASEPVTLARCLAAVAEWVSRAPRLDPVSAMVESGGSPLVRRVGRILGREVDRRAWSPRAALGASVCALLALATTAPRVSVASAMLTDRTVTLVRSLVEQHDEAQPRGALVMLRSRGERVAAESRVANVVVLGRRESR